MERTHKINPLNLKFKIKESYDGEEYEENENTNWGQSVSGVVIYENKVLLARHTYGGGLGN